MPLQATSGAASYDGFGGGVAAVPNYIEDVFSTYLYTGNGGTQTITNSIDLSTKGGLVWIKQRNSTAISGGLPSQHLLFDTNRGANNMLASNSTYQSLALVGYSFNNTGFTVAQYTNTDGTYPYEGNQSSVPYASWTFRKQPKFFDVVTYTGNGTVKTVNHSLGSVPGVMIVKCTSVAGENWAVYHRSLGATKYIELNNTNAASTSVGSRWDAEPTSTSFSVGYNGSVNSSGATYVAYLFAHNAGGFGLTGTDNVISCGSYTGNTTSLQSINLGYEPQLVLIKSASIAGTEWAMLDNMRGVATGGVDAVLNPNTSGAEASPFDRVDFTATGFNLKTSSSIYNETGTYIYIAIRRGPMKVPTSGTSVYNALDLTGTGSTVSRTGVGFAPDLIINRSHSNDQTWWADKLRGRNGYIGASNTNAESGSASTSTQDLVSFDMNGVTFGTPNYSGYNNSGDLEINWFMRRAPSFFDEVCSTGDGVGTALNHNLTVVPELYIQKRRDIAGQNWFVWAPGGNQLKLNLTDAGTTPGFTIGTSTTFNPISYASGGTYVNYLFATCAGVSKVGSYTGNGSSQTINCGFTGGARFVLIKRTDSTGDWYVWDTARGIVTANDPHLSLNTTAAEVTTDDTIDTDSTGFVVNQVTATNVNVSAATYIYLAIA